MTTKSPTPSVRDQALSFIRDMLSASESVVSASPLLDDDLLENLRPLFAPGREITGAEVRAAVLASLARCGFRPFISQSRPEEDWLETRGVPVTRE